MTPIKNNVFRRARFRARLIALWQVVRDDQRRFYCRAVGVRFGIVLFLASVLANTSLDQAVRDWCQARRDHASLAESIHAVTKQFGQAGNILAGAGGAALIGLAAGCPGAAAVGTWGTKMLRALAVAAPPLFIGQRLLGGSRPVEHNNQPERGSAWRFCRDSNAISGHAMAGALPFLVAADMMSHPAAQAVLYACSGLTAVSRINSDSHYLSQIILGWWLAWLAARTVRPGGQRLFAATTGT